MQNQIKKNKQNQNEIKEKTPDFSKQMKKNIQKMPEITDKKIEALIKKIYPNNYEEIKSKLKDLIIKYKIHNNLHLFSYYKYINLYVVYPDSFKNKGKKNFTTVLDNLKRLKNMGFNGIHILPFLESPMVDNGFDVADFTKVRENLGGNQAFEAFLEKCKEMNIKVFMDLVLNHVSNQHTWFQLAVNGDENYRQFFYTSKEKPILIKTFKDEGGVWARYLINNKEVDIRIIFPEQCGDMPHWSKERDGFWYYHTFYPTQLDLNWYSPNLFLEIAEEILYWGNKGLSFRLDAIPYLGKSFQDCIFESNHTTHAVVRLLNFIVKEVSPESIFLVEAFQGQEKTLQYFGDEENLESEMAYNFEVMNNLWLALIEKDITGLWNDIRNYEKLPAWGQWVTFLRNHDELSFEFAPKQVRQSIYSKLIRHGMDFRSGFAVTGRTFSFLEDNVEHVILAHALLLSIPGTPAIIYGDELGIENNFSYMHEKYQDKLKQCSGKTLMRDTRDINRGYVLERDLYTQKAKRISRAIKSMLSMRLMYKTVYTQVPQKVHAESGIFACKYKLDNSLSLYIYLNLLDCKQHINLDTTSIKQKIEINDVKIDPKKNPRSIALGGYSGVWIVL